jgi:hypothetical protein
MPEEEMMMQGSMTRIYGFGLIRASPDIGERIDTNGLLIRINQNIC